MHLRAVVTGTPPTRAHLAVNAWVLSAAEGDPLAVETGSAGHLAALLPAPHPLGDEAAASALEAASTAWARGSSRDDVIDALVTSLRENHPLFTGVRLHALQLDLSGDSIHVSSGGHVMTFVEAGGYLGRLDRGRYPTLSPGIGFGPPEQVTLRPGETFHALLTAQVPSVEVADHFTTWVTRGGDVGTPWLGGPALVLAITASRSGHVSR